MGLYAVSVPEGGEAGAFCIATPYEALGKVRVQWFQKDFKEIVELQHTYQAHNGAIKAMAINRSGTLCATASDKGTLIRLFDAKCGEKWAEFRRGT